MSDEQQRAIDDALLMFTMTVLAGACVAARVQPAEPSCLSCRRLEEASSAPMFCPACGGHGRIGDDECESCQGVGDFGAKAGALCDVDRLTLALTTAQQERDDWKRIAEQRLERAERLQAEVNEWSD